MDIKDNYLTIKQEILDQSVGLTNSKDVKLIAVSKTFAVDKVKNVYDLGQRDFAENYVSEFVEKWEKLKDLDIRWHFIGHLQTNKVDKVVGLADLIHSVDSEKVLKKIISCAQKKMIQQSILLQVKFGDEATKFGLTLKELPLLIQDYSKNKNIKFCGLMCILPLGISEVDKKKYFSTLREAKLSISNQSNELKDFNELSMGMSDDFKLAISEGSTMIRIGSAIFGVRQ